MAQWNKIFHFIYYFTGQKQSQTQWRTNKEQIEKNMKYMYMMKRR